MFKSLTTFFNLGRKVPAPGTFGSIIGVIIWLILDYYSFFGFDFSIIIISFIVIFFISANACSKYIISSFNKDPSEIIIDEIFE